MSVFPKKELSLFDSICIFVGIIIGAGIYENAPSIAACMANPTGTLAIWLIGGLLALTGALCYAELASAWPGAGGDFIYLTRAYGRGVGFLFGWTQLAIVRPGDVTLMAFVFARYAMNLFGFHESFLKYAAMSAIIVFTVINVIGVREGKWTQNILTVAKILGLIAIIVAAIMAPHNAVPLKSDGLTAGGLGLALILVLYTFGGWNEMAYVAAEVKNPQKNIIRALVIGVAVVTLLYVLINGAFLYALGYENMAESKAVAVDAMRSGFPDVTGEVVGKIISVIICISALGAINGLVFTGARISYAIGTEHHIFKGLGQWHPKRRTPAKALVIQGLLSVAIAFCAESFIDTLMFITPVVWIFFLLTCFSVIVLRLKEPKASRPYKITGYPAPVIIFISCCIYMLYCSVDYTLKNMPGALGLVAGILFIGFIAYHISELTDSQRDH